VNLLPDWRATAHALLGLLFPPRCAVCQSSPGWLCETCLQEIEFIRPPFCPLCGQPTRTSRLCPSCERTPPRVDGIRAVGYLEGTLQTAIHRFKYSNVRPLAAPLGKLAGEYLTGSGIPADVVHPVPLHSRRLRERGYNQAALLAKEIGASVGLPMIGGVLLRTKSTVPQVGLNAAQRRENVQDAFQCADRSLTGRRVLLVDDVCTTGATLDACSDALREGGAKLVWGLVLARERSHHR
jgi:ComF family protein